MRSFKKRAAALSCAVLIAAALVSGCASTGNKVKLDPSNPVTISIWHYYNGAIMNAFESSVAKFNETVGTEKGIIVETFGHGTVGQLEKAVLSSSNKEIGSMEMPNIFASYADTAYEAEKLGLLANLDDNFTKKEQEEYIDSYIEEGKIGLNGELRIFPIAKSTEMLLINETDWTPFAEANSVTYDDLKTVEGITAVSEKYYNWTDAKTPEIANDGKAFFGRDAMANLFIVASKEFGIDIFEVNNGTTSINVDRDVMRKVWDNYYVPFIKGHFFAYGRFRSEDAKVGDILAYVGSTASAAYFPTEVVADGQTYPVTARVLPLPHFDGIQKIMVQQGAGMVVTKSTPEEEYASVEFLKWFTAAENNIGFAAASGYMPVKKEAADYDVMKTRIEADGITLDEITDKTLNSALSETKTSQLYTNKAFDGGVAARAVLDYNLQDKATADREAVVQMLESGSTLDEAVASFNTEEKFNAWLENITAELNKK